MPRCSQCANYIRRYDEYYTRYEHVKDIFDRYIPANSLKDKIIYCPCDSDKSNFVIYLKEHKDDLQYKELIYTWDDYNTHIDLFEYADVIITNPPFSKLVKEFIPILNKINKKFFILGSQITHYSYVRHFEIDDVKYIRDNTRFDFIVPEDCELDNTPLYIYITNLESKNYSKEPKFDDPKEPVYCIYNGKRYKNYDRINNIPLDEKDEILVPVTVYLEHNRKYFDIIDNNMKLREYEDNKGRYVRILVKRKINKD